MFDIKIKDEWYLFPVVFYVSICVGWATADFVMRLF